MHGLLSNIGGRSPGLPKVDAYAHGCPLIIGKWLELLNFKTYAKQMVSWRSLVDEKILSVK